jgi:hypothetical protein
MGGLIVRAGKRIRSQWPLRHLTGGSDARGSFRVSAYADGFFNRTPSPPPFFSMNSMPASSSARRIARSFGAVSEVAAPVSSARRIVVSPTVDERARSSALQRRSARAARICALVSAGDVDFFILYGMFHSIEI